MKIVLVYHQRTWITNQGTPKRAGKNEFSGNRSRVLVGRTRTKFAEANQHKSRAMHEKYEEAAIRTIMEDTYASHSSSLTLCYVGFVLSVLHAQRHYKRIIFHRGK